MAKQVTFDATSLIRQIQIEVTIINKDKLWNRARLFVFFADVVARLLGFDGVYLVNNIEEDAE